MSEEKTVQETLAELIDKTIPGVMETIMADETLHTQRKASMIGLANSALHQLRLLRGALEE